MKNIFKLMGVALMACSMMVACKPENTDPNDTTPDNPQPQPEQAVFTVKWDNADQTIGFKNILRDNSMLQNPTTSEPIPVYMVECAKGLNGDDYEFPAFITYYISANNQTYIGEQVSIDANGTTFGDYYPCEVYETGGIDINGTIYGDYLVSGINTPATITVDPTAMKISVSVGLKFYSLEEYIQTQDIANTTTKDFVLTVSNYAFADGSLKK